MKYTFDWFHKDPAKIIESKTGLIEKTGLISKSGLITGTTTGGISHEFEI